MAIAAGVAALGAGTSTLALLLPLIVLVGGIVWSFRGAAEPESTGNGWVVTGGIVGVVAIAAGLVALGGDAGWKALVLLLLPLAALIGGLMWSLEGAQLPVGDPAAAAVVGSPPAMPASDAAGATSAAHGHVSLLSAGEQGGSDVPTMLPAPEPEGEVVSEAVRMDGARTFDLTPFLVDDIPDRIQCSNCGRYTHLLRGSDNSVSCAACGATRGLSRVQPDTFVRMIVGSAAGMPDGAAGGSASNATPAGTSSDPNVDPMTTVPRGG